MRRKGILTKYLILSALLAMIGLSACGSPNLEEQDLDGAERKSYLSELPDLMPVSLSVGEKLRVVATTSIVGDVVSEVGGGEIDITTLLPANVDPHSYEPTPADLREVSDAHVVFINGLGLEEFLEGMLKNVGSDVPVVSLSTGLEHIILGDETLDEEHASEEPKDAQDHGAYDPHVWFDPTNVMIWAERVAQALSILDPGNRLFYETRAAGYHEQLRELDQWIFMRVSYLSEEDRRFVTDHRVFDYFAARYGFEVVGALIPAFSSAAEPSAREIADLQDRILDLGIKVIFIGETINPDVAEAIVEDTGTQMIPLYTGSLSGQEGPAATYLDFMRYNVDSIVNALLEWE